ncbi:MAG: Holliday junction branch migration protein RuvA [Muribaculaceae bacterium]|nr:Holliday junction branch migration protein RuvA [Muribaculaceae bacterium]
MLDYIRGHVAELTPTFVVLDVNGLGYEVNITLLDYPEIPATGEAKLYVHESIREDAHILFGFLSKRSRELFRLLLSVNGVGANTARLFLSALTVRQLETAIASGEEKLLKSVKGVGAKTAQRIILDLKDKVKPDASVMAGTVSKSEAFDDAQAALVMLGFAQAQCAKVLGKLFATEPTLSTEEAIKRALTML